MCAVALRSEETAKKRIRKNAPDEVFTVIINSLGSTSKSHRVAIADILVRVYTDCQYAAVLLFPRHQNATSLVGNWTRI